MDSPGALVPRSAFLPAGTRLSSDVEAPPPSPRRRGRASPAATGEDAAAACAGDLPPPRPSKASSAGTAASRPSRVRVGLYLTTAAVLAATALLAGGFFLAKSSAVRGGAAAARPPADAATPSGADAADGGGDWRAAPSLGRPLIGTGPAAGFASPAPSRASTTSATGTAPAWTRPPPPARARYAALGAAVAPGVRRYNTFWASFEPAYPPPPPSTPCPAGTIAWTRPDATPPRRHCYDRGVVERVGAFLAADAAHGVQSVATLWKAPPGARAPGCGGWAPPQGVRVASTAAAGGGAGGGAPRAAARDRSGCAPALAAVETGWSDFVAFLGDAYRAPGGHFSGYIVWNEAASNRWYDVSGDAGPPPPPPGSPARAHYVATRYASLINATAAALASVRAAPALVYASLDDVWAPPAGGLWEGAPHVGSGPLVEGLWAELGVAVDWSVAGHFYGAPDGDGWPTVYRLRDAAALAASQRAAAAAAGHPDPDRAPQTVVAATEQGWPAAGADAPAAAASVCRAHAIALATPSLAFVTHNDFQGPAPGDAVGLVPADAGPFLNTSTAAVSPTLAAYRSTAAAVWGRDGAHYCCLVVGLGCGGAAA